MPITATINLCTKYGHFLARHHMGETGQALTLTAGDLGKPLPLVRIQSSCLFSQTFADTSCDCLAQLTESMKLIQSEGNGVLVYLFQEGRGVGLEKKMLSISVQQTHVVDTVEAFKILGYESPDLRQYGLAIQSLHEIGVSKNIRLISNNLNKKNALETNHFNVHSLIRLSYKVNRAAYEYLLTKAHKMGHAIDFSKITVLDE